MRTARCRAVSASSLPCIRDRLQAIEIEPRIAGTLIRDEAAHAFGGDRARCLRKRGGLGFEICQRRPGGTLVRATDRDRQLIARGGEPGAESFQVALDRFAVRLDGGLEGLDGNRQPARAGNRAEHHRVDDRAGLPGGGFHVEQQVRLGILLDRLDQALRVIAPVRHLHLLDRQIDAAGRGEEQRPVGGDEPRSRSRGRPRAVRSPPPCRRRRRRARARAPGFCRRARRAAWGRSRRSRSWRRCAARRRGSRSTAPAGPAGSRGGHDPVGQHAAALAAERGDQQAEGTRAHAATSRGASHEITLRRRRCMKRSQALAFWISSAR